MMLMMMTLRTHVELRTELRWLVGGDLHKKMDSRKNGKYFGFSVGFSCFVRYHFEVFDALSLSHTVLSALYFSLKARGNCLFTLFLIIKVISAGGFY